jgi:uncharacterized RDD family membrane protein YckC
MSRPAPDLAVDSVTGIDVSLAVAGPGARSYAFLVDWHIRFFLGFAWYAFAALIYNGRLTLIAPESPHGRWFGLVVLPAAAIYLLYHHVLELAMRGRTPGKRLAGLHVVARDGGAPSAGALLTRNVFRLIDSLPLCYGVGLLAVALTREHLRVGDMAAGTLLVYEREAALPEHAAPGGALDPAAREVVQELLARWQALEPGARARLAQQALARYAPDGAGAAGGEPGDEALRTRLERLARP